MSIHRFEIALRIDDERLAEHPGEKKAPPNDPSEWDASDLFLAAELGLVDVRASEITWYDGRRKRASARKHREGGVVTVTAELPILDGTYSVEWKVEGPVQLSEKDSRMQLSAKESRVGGRRSHDAPPPEEG
jgi:hypothetical protein